MKLISCATDLHSIVVIIVLVVASHLYCHNFSYNCQ